MRARSWLNRERGKVVDRGTKYPKIFIDVPIDMVKDSTFPFEVGEGVTVTIDGERLIIEKRRQKSTKSGYEKMGKFRLE